MTDSSVSRGATGPEVDEKWVRFPDAAAETAGGQFERNSEVI